MKIIAFTKRLLRDTTTPDPALLDADARQELLDAINATVQRINSVAPTHSRITTAALELAAPSTVTLTVENGSNQFTGYLATEQDLHCTIRLDGDAVDNHLTGAGDLLFNYAGASGTVQATIYHDALTLPQTIAEITGVPMVLGEWQELRLDSARQMRAISRRAIASPRYWWMEPNPAPAKQVFRVESLPPQLTRIEVEVLSAPLRITLLDMLSDTADLPFREDVTESYVLPMARGELAESSLWRVEATRAAAIAKGKIAFESYIFTISHHLATPENRVGTPKGY